MIKVVTGDIRNTDAKYICHQVNCQNAMGSGVAKALYQKWPNVKSEYHSFCDSYEPNELLGKMQIVPVDAYGGLQRQLVRWSTAAVR